MLAMEAFYMVLTLSSPAGPDVLLFSHPQRWTNELACRRALPRMEAAVTRLIRIDAAALNLFGETAGGPLNRGYFVTASACWSAEPSP